MPYIHSITTGFPEHRFDCAQALELVDIWLKREEEKKSKAHSIFRNAGVETRYAAIPVEDLFIRRSFKEKNELWLDKALQLTEKVISQTLDKSKMAPKEVDAIFVSTCTGYSLPGLECHIVNSFGFRSDVRRMPFLQFGCSGGVRAVMAAHDYLIAYPNNTALVLSIELPTLTFCPEDTSMANVVSAALFGDGSACVVMAGEKSQKGGAFRTTEVATHLFPNSCQLMGFQLSDLGFKMILDKSLTLLIARHAREPLWSFLISQQLSPDFAAIHPGGSGVLKVLEENCELSATLLEPAHKILRDYGNMSGTTVLVILHHILNNGVQGSGLLAAFGPGFSLDMIALSGD